MSAVATNSIIKAIWVRFKSWESFPKDLNSMIQVEYTRQQENLQVD